MSTDLYYIKVLEKKGLEVRLRVTVVYYDIQRPPHSSETEFFLLLLLDEAYSYSPSLPDAPIAQVISEQQRDDWNFRRKYSRRYIDEVVQLQSDATQPNDSRPAADYLLSVTDARWIAHLQSGDAWRSASFAGRGY